MGTSVSGNVPLPQWATRRLPRRTSINGAARRKLKQQDISSTQPFENTRQELGYADPANLVRAFRRMSGYTPTGFRRKIKGDEAE